MVPTAGQGGLLDWLHATALSNAMRTGLWNYPAVEIVHIFGFAILVGAVALFDLRVLGVSKNLPVQALARHLLPWAVGALVLIVPAGLLMFIAHPHDFVASNVFRLKLALIAAAGINAAVFHATAYRQAALWDTGAVAPGAAKFQAVLSIAIWLGVISCGRLLAYT